MKLTGKSKKDFLKWYYKNIHYVGLCDIECHLDQTINALIIEFFNSFQYKGMPMFEYCFNFFWKQKIQSISFNQVCIQSIEKANELYNEAQ